MDGHDVHRLISTLRDLKDIKGPVFLHVITAKGHGYEPAQKDPSAYHGVSSPKKAPAEPTLVRASAPEAPRMFSMDYIRRLTVRCRKKN